MKNYLIINELFDKGIIEREIEAIDLSLTPDNGVVLSTCGTFLNLESIFHSLDYNRIIYIHIKSNFHNLFYIYFNVRHKEKVDYPLISTEKCNEHIISYIKDNVNTIHEITDQQILEMKYMWS